VVKDDQVPSENRVLACEALGALGKTAVDALPVLRTAEKSKDRALAEIDAVKAELGYRAAYVKVMSLIGKQ